MVRFGRLLGVWVVVVCVAGVAAAGALAFGAQVRVSFLAPARVIADGPVTFSGGVRGVSPGSALAVQERAGSRWAVVVRGRVGRGGRFALAWAAPARAGRVTVRAVVLSGRGGLLGASLSRRVTVSGRKGPAVLVSAKTQVLAASTVTSAPAAGAAGTLTYSGGNSVQAGQIIAIGQGAATPDGFLGRVVSFSQSGGVTVVHTVPATLMQAVPTGSFDVTLSQAPEGSSIRRGSRRADSIITCGGSVRASVDAQAQVGVRIDVKGSWSLLGGLQSASLSGGASASASVTATVQGAGECKLSPVQLLNLKGPGGTFFIGPVPFVITSQLLVDLDASATVDAKLQTGISGGYSATAGVGWTKTGGFYPIDSFGPSFKYTPPALTANADVQASVDPTIQVSLDGAGHADLNLSAGLDLSADTTQNPWWTLTAPVSLTGDLNISTLGLHSPKLTLYKHSFPLAHASGAFGTGGTGGTIAAGLWHTCALLAGGTVDCWGDTGSSWPVAVSGIANATQITAGDHHTCALLAGGRIDCWGDNRYGELGNGTTNDSSTPVAVSGITNATQITAGYEHTCALLAGGTVDCWGYNDYGELGNATTITNSSTPVAVTGITNATQITAGYGHACALLAGGQIDCWGHNDSGQLGNGTTTDSSTPVAVSGITNATQITAGYEHTCALLAGGTVDCWGANESGELGNGTTTDSVTPVAVRGITNATQITDGEFHTCALLAGGQIDCWGANDYGELGNGTWTESSTTTPVAVRRITNATQITAGGEHTCALLAGGQIDCWGANDYGQLGNGTTTDAATTTPVAVSGIP